MYIERVAVIVDDYDVAISFFVSQTAYEDMRQKGVEFVTEPQDEPMAGSLFFVTSPVTGDLLGPSSASAAAGMPGRA